MLAESTSDGKKIEIKIQAWEDREKTKADNKAERKLASTEVWKSTTKATLEAEVKKIDAGLEKLRLKEMEKVKNKEAETNKAVESKKASIEAKREQQKQRVEEKAAKHRSTNTIPTKCFGICND
ncbi:unnamed protein product [Citrullus colocynthis]|uniref:Remorin C-terminal domain-containing protein n=1 Tax=Citrullus colocynthis TaxID=252529 RepID=A0ABP0YCQ5_9ROSI